MEDINKEFNESSKTTTNKIDERDRLKFAKQILFAMFSIFIIVFVAYGMYPTNPALKEVFELTKIGGCSLVTLVISFYFTSSITK